MKYRQAEERAGDRTFTPKMAENAKPKSTPYKLSTGRGFYLLGRALRRITPRIPDRQRRKEPVAYDKELYKQRHKIEIMFGRLKDWRRIATRYDRCAHTFLSSICITAIVIFYL